MLSEAILQGLVMEALALPVYPNLLFPPSAYYRFLQVLARHVQPQLSVELGVCGGGGSLHLALGWTKGKVVGVDGAWDHPEHIGVVRQVCPNFEFWHGDSVGSAPSIYDKYGPVDILFVDTTHTYEQTRREFDGWYPYLSGRAVVCFDDLYRPTMPEFWDTLEGNKQRLDIIHDTGGFGVWWL